MGKFRRIKLLFGLAAAGGVIAASGGCVGPAGLKGRPLTPGETTLAREVFGDAIDYKKVTVYNGPPKIAGLIEINKANLGSISPGGNIYLVSPNCTKPASTPCPRPTRRPTGGSAVTFTTVRIAPTWGQARESGTLCCPSTTLLADPLASRRAERDQTHRSERHGAGLGNRTDRGLALIAAGTTTATKTWIGIGVGGRAATILLAVVHLVAQVDCERRRSRQRSEQDECE